MSLPVLLKRRVAPFLAARLPPGLAWLAAGKPVVIPYYHVVSDEPVPHVKHLYRFRSVAEFEQDLDYFLRRYAPVTLQQLIAHLHSGAPLPARPLHLTFDDGFREMHDLVMPILLKKGLPATFFIATAFVDNADMAHHNRISVLLDWLDNKNAGPARRKVEAFLDKNGVPGADLASRLLSTTYPQRHLVKQAAALAECDLTAYLKEKQPFLTSTQLHALLRAGFALGAHSLDHPKYAEIDEPEQLRQTCESVRFIVERFHTSCSSFAFPLTAEGVSPRFFAAIFDQQDLKISFGTGGMARHFCPCHLERFSMEKTDWPAQMILARQYLKKPRRS